MSGQPISGHKGRDRWLRAILTRDVLKLLEVRVAVLLGIHFNCTDGRCDPGYDTLAGELGISRRTLFRAFARLKADGWIEVHRVGRDEKVRFSLFIRPQLASPSDTQPARGASVLSPQEVPAYWHLSEPPEQPHEVTENGVRGDKNRGVEVTDRLAAQKNLKPENLKSPAVPAGRTSRAVRESATTNSATVDDAPPIQRAPDGALIATVAAQQQPPSSRNNPIGAPASANADGFDAMRRLQFQNVTRVYPPNRIGDEDEAYKQFCATIAARGRLSTVIEAVKDLICESGGDVPWLADLLKTIERMS